MIFWLHKNDHFCSWRFREWITTSLKYLKTGWNYVLFSLDPEYFVQLEEHFGTEGVIGRTIHVFQFIKLQVILHEFTLLLVDFLWKGIFDFIHPGSIASLVSFISSWIRAVAFALTQSYNWGWPRVGAHLLINTILLLKKLSNFWMGNTLGSLNVTCLWKEEIRIRIGLEQAHLLRACVGRAIECFLLVGNSP